MSNEELKKKIVEIIINAIWKDAEADYDSTDETEACSIADALIAAGIVDKSDYASMKETAVRYKAEVSKAKGRAKEAELRAEVAESELERYTGRIKPLEDENTRLKHRAEVAERALELMARGECTFASPEYYKKQAEKELAEEGKEW